jgi:hypothetical protein
MYLLFLRNGEAANTNQITMGQIVKKDGSKKDFAVTPGNVNKTEFEFGDKVICLRGTFTVIINQGKQNQMVEAITMYDRYWMPNREIVLSEAFMKEHKLELPKLALTGVNHRVHTGKVLR